MVNFKHQVAEILKKLPDTCTAEDVQYTLYVNELIRRRLESAHDVQPLTQAIVEERLSKWLMK